MTSFSRILFLSMCILCIPQLSSSQTRYQMAYGGSQNDIGQSLIPSGSGYVILGTTNSFGAGNYDMYLLGIDSCGDYNYSRTVGGTSSDFGYDILQNIAGHYVLYGSTKSFGHGDYDTYLAELNSGKSAVKRSWVVGDTLKEEGQAIVETKDTTGYVGVGYTNSYGAGNTDVYVIKYNYNGTVAWTKVYGGEQMDKGYDIQRTKDGGYIITGETKSYGAGGSDVYLLKLDASGNLSWAREYGTAGDDVGYSVKQTSDQGFIITGYTELGDTAPYKRNIYLIRTDQFGYKIWSYAYGGTNDDEGHCVNILSDYSYTVCGYTKSYGAGLEDAYLIKVSTNGTPLWGYTYGSDSIDRCLCSIVNSDTSITFTGYTYGFGNGKADVYVVKTDLYGYSGCHQDTGLVRYTIYDYLDSDALASTGGKLDTGGIVEVPMTLTDTICNSCDTLYGRSSGFLQGNQNLDFSIYPVPAHAGVYVNLYTSANGTLYLRLFDLAGTQILSKATWGQSAYLPFNNLAAGMYFLEMQVGNQIARSKILVQ